MIINRVWAMPNKNTFSIKPINKLIKRIICETDVRKCLNGRAVIVDPFCNGFAYGTHNNDLDTTLEAEYHMDALDFLKTFSSESVDCVLFDPPYSPRQVTECYKKLGKTVNMQTTQSSYWSKLKKEISRIAQKGCTVVTCGWNSGGIGMSYGFTIKEILIVPHGGWHNDTIITIEIKDKGRNE